jgi:hypothetical protein
MNWRCTGHVRAVEWGSGSERIRMCASDCGDDARAGGGVAQGGARAARGAQTAPLPRRPTGWCQGATGVGPAFMLICESFFHSAIFLGHTFKREAMSSEEAPATVSPRDEAAVEQQGEGGQESEEEIDESMYNPDSRAAIQPEHLRVDAAALAAERDSAEVIVQVPDATSESAQPPVSTSSQKEDADDNHVWCCFGARRAQTEESAQH